MSIKSTLTAIACICVLSFAALPEIRITTKGNQNPDNGSGGMWGGTTTYNYIPVDKIELTDPNNSRNNLTSNTTSGTVVDSIKVRGNSTAGLDKKPYRIKFKDKKSLFDKVEAKSWVLLANYYDGTFALNAIAFEMGRRMGLEFTNSSQMADVWINGTYKGLYQLTEQVQSHKGRVDLKEKHNGWLAEFDYHDAASDERNQWFKTAKYDIGTFIKWPQLDDTSFTKNPNDVSQLNFVKTDINNLVNKMSENGFPTNGYRDMIDMESFAKYVLVQLVMDNFDFNSKAQTGFLLGSNYAYKIEDCAKIKAGPLWDFDLAAGLERMSNGGMGGFGGAGSFPAHYKTYQDSIAPTHAFYRRLWEDPVFKAKYKKLWDKHKSDFQAMSSFIDNIKSQVEGSVQSKGNNKWANNQMSGSANLTTQQFNTEVTNLKSWWADRINWVDQKLNSYNINTSADIVESTPVCNAGSSSSKANTASSSSIASSSSTASSSSVASSSSSNFSWQTCDDYQPSWCGGNTPMNNTTTKPTTGQCVFVKDYTMLTTSSGGGTVIINGTTCAGSYMNCVTNKPEAKDGGYYIYVQAGAISSSQSYNVTAGAPVCGTTPILLTQATFSNLPQGTKVEVYNLQGKQVYSGYSGNSQILQIPVQTKGIYIVRTTHGSDKKIQRFVVK
jgi:hypothetical protein